MTTPIAAIGADIFGSIAAVARLGATGGSKYEDEREARAARDQNRDIVVAESDSIIADLQTKHQELAEVLRGGRRAPLKMQEYWKGLGIDLASFKDISTAAAFYRSTVDTDFQAARQKMEEKNPGFPEISKRFAEKNLETSRYIKYDLDSEALSGKVSLKTETPFGTKKGEKVQRINLFTGETEEFMSEGFLNPGPVAASTLSSAYITSASLEQNSGISNFNSKTSETYKDLQKFFQNKHTLTDFLSPQNPEGAYAADNRIASLPKGEIKDSAQHQARSKLLGMYVGGLLDGSFKLRRNATDDMRKVVDGLYERKEAFDVSEGSAAIISSGKLNPKLSNALGTLTGIKNLLVSAHGSVQKDQTEELHKLVQTVASLPNVFPDDETRDSFIKTIVEKELGFTKTAFEGMKEEVDLLIKGELKEAELLKERNLAELQKTRGDLHK